MTNKDFIKALEKACACKTYYIKGGFGQRLTEDRKKKLISQYKYNKDREKKIMALDQYTFAFDCCGLVKGCIWNFTGDVTKIYGGASYESNGLKDVNEKGLFNLCTNISDDMTNIIPGEFLYMSGHCGVYLGDGKVAESTPSGACGAQITSFNRVKWKAHAMLPFINYEVKETKPALNLVLPSFYLREGSRGMNVYNLQRCLNSLGANLVTDGMFGPLTKKALVNFQKECHIAQDGVYGPITQRELREAIK